MGIDPPGERTEARVSDKTVNGVNKAKLRQWGLPALAGPGCGLLFWLVLGQAALASAMAVLLAGAAWLACRPAASPETVPAAPLSDARRARQMAETARTQLDRIVAQAGMTRDDELALRARRLDNTATLMTEMLLDAPARHRELQPFLETTLTRTAEMTERYLETRDIAARHALLRHLQETEQQLEYGVRSLVTGTGGRAHG